jgi:hypothetical protein
MQHAKRMVLVDEKFLEHFWRKEDSSWKRPTEQKAKSHLNRELKSDLDDPNIPDDIKAKQHQQHLNRFLHTTRQLPAVEPETLIDLKSPSIDDLLGLKADSIKKKEKKAVKKAVFPVRKSTRKVKKIKWDAWE